MNDGLIPWPIVVDPDGVAEAGPPGPPGPMPRHKWEGTALAFEQGPDGKQWGPSVDLEGPRGEPGTQTIVHAGGGSFPVPAAAGGKQVFVSATQPANLPAEAIWIQTAINGNPDDFTLWFNDDA